MHMLDLGDLECLAGHLEQLVGFSKCAALCDMTLERNLALEDVEHSRLEVGLETSKSLQGGSGTTLGTPHCAMEISRAALRGSMRFCLCGLLDGTGAAWPQSLINPRN